MNKMDYSSVGGMEKRKMVRITHWTTLTLKGLK
jgi:hypothetical protein